MMQSLRTRSNYSEDAATTEVTIYGLTPKNVIVSFDEMVLQSGIHTNTEFGSSAYTCLTFAGLCRNYLTIQCNEGGGSVILKLQDGQSSGEYMAARKNLAADFISTALLSGKNSAVLWFRASEDGVNFGDWNVFAPVTTTTQYIDFKAVL
jgi:hypothetical protein